jgi:hypothetical protein
MTNITSLVNASSTPRRLEDVLPLEVWDKVLGFLRQLFGETPYQGQLFAAIISVNKAWAVGHALQVTKSIVTDDNILSVSRRTPSISPYDSRISRVAAARSLSVS